jgi:3-hydroxyacyl-[acyl-carrier-protein] dehydratase
MRYILVDSIIKLIPGQRIEAEKTFSSSEEFFADHYPGFPVVPGVLLVEIMGQTADKCIYSGNPQLGRPMLAQIRSASFRRWVRPDERMQVFAEIVSGKASFATAKCRLEVEQQLAAQAELLFTFVSEDSLTDGYTDLVLNAYLAQQATKG